MRSVSGTPILKEAATVHKCHANGSSLDSIVPAGWRRGDDDWICTIRDRCRDRRHAAPRACIRINAMQTPCKLLRNLFFDSRVRARSRLYSQPYIRMECRRYRRLASRNPRTRSQIFELISLKYKIQKFRII